MPAYIIKLEDISGESRDTSTTDTDSFDFAVEPDVDPIALLLPAVQAARDAEPGTSDDNLQLSTHDQDFVVDDRTEDFIAEDWVA